LEPDWLGRAHGGYVGLAFVAIGERFWKPSDATHQKGFRLAQSIPERKIKAMEERRDCEMASLTMRSNREDDLWYLNAKRMGPTSPKALKIAPGRYEILVRKPGFLTWFAVVNLEPGEMKTFRAELTPQQDGSWAANALRRGSESKEGVRPRMAPNWYPPWWPNPPGS
jgi:hypothetical protein